MKKILAYSRTLTQNLTGKSFLVIGSVSLLYIFLSVYAINRSLIINTISGNMPMEYKTTLLQTLLIDSWGLFRPTESMLLVLIAVLMGINIALMIRTFRGLQAKNGVKFSFGGSSMVAVMSVGCPGCGISLLSMLGVTSPLLPLQGIALQITSLTLLTGSFIYLLYKLQQPVACNIASVNGEAMKPRHR